MSLITQATSPQSEVRPRSYLRVTVAGLFVVFPAILFYTILFRTVQNIPLFDGYGGLAFMNKLTQLNGFTAKAAFLLTTQFNEYKFVFAEALTWLQFDLLGRVDFKVMSAISNAFVLSLAFVLWKMFLPAHKDLGARLALFIPASWLLFQLQYFEILNGGGAGLQHIPSTVFAFAAIYLLFQETRKTFCGAMAFYVLAIASSGNGFLLLPIGLLVLAVCRRYARIAAWLITSAACIAVYFYHYNVMSSQSSQDHSILSALLQLRPAYVISFIGSAASFPFPAVSYVLGTALCLFFTWMAFRGYVRKNPVVSCCVLFLLLTAIGAAGLRPDLALMGYTPPRYTMFSIIFVIFAWFGIVEEFLQNDPAPLLNNRGYLAAVTAAVLFCLFADGVGFAGINNWDNQLIQGMTSFEHPDPPDSTEGPGIASWKGHPEVEAFNMRARAILKESIKLGVYRPPKL